MGYFSDSRRNWAGAFWAATAIPLVLDPSNPIWDESGWWEEQFGAPYAPLGPSGGNDYFTPNFWAGRGSETVGRRGPRTSPKVSPIIRGTCGTQSSNMILQKNLPWTPPLKIALNRIGSHLCSPFCVLRHPQAVIYDIQKNYLVRARYKIRVAHTVDGYTLFWTILYIAEPVTPQSPRLQFLALSCSKDGAQAYFMTIRSMGVQPLYW